MSIDPLDLCLNIGRAHASLNLKLHEDLGAFHGLDYEDFTLLHRLLCAEDGRMAMADLARSLGLPISALIRKMVLLEKRDWPNARPARMERAAMQPFAPAAEN